MPRRLLLSALALAWSAPAFAGPINPWGVLVGKGTVAVTPFIFVDQTVGVYPYVYGEYGFTDNFELLAGVGFTVVPGFSFDSVELMPRYWFSDTTGVALHATYVPGDTGVAVAPEYQGVYPLGPLTLTVNAGWAPYFGGASGFAPGEAYAFVAPEWYFTDASSLFLEVDPRYDIGGNAFTLDLVPGVSTSIAEKHYFAIGVDVPVVTGAAFDPSGIYLGAWYSIAFGGGGDE